MCAALLGVLAGLVGVFDTIPYLRDVLKGSTRPHRGTWLIWSALAVVVCLSQWADGASWSLIMLMTQAVLTTTVFAVAIVHGQGGTTIAELVLMTVAAVGVTGWLLSGEPLVATVCVVAADLIAAAMMVPKTYRDPGSETLATFVYASIGGALAAAAVGVADDAAVALLLYPIYYCLANGAIALLIHRRRAVLGLV
ncbi:MAG: hypothetical protein QOH17_3961 [Pseudonocardiales bacterium]|jgi:hypothetical protein|nr:hypothetical protein [Pseudonocardiales bacterium]MDT7577628.1 hypothetical protein [Pseudonocardiales bacterium]